MLFVFDGVFDAPPLCYYNILFELDQFVKEEYFRIKFKLKIFENGKA